MMGRLVSFIAYHRCMALVGTPKAPSTTRTMLHLKKLCITPLRYCKTGSYCTGEITKLLPFHKESSFILGMVYLASREKFHHLFEFYVAFFRNYPPFQISVLNEEKARSPVLEWHLNLTHLS